MTHTRLTRNQAVTTHRQSTGSPLFEHNAVRSPATATQHLVTHKASSRFKSNLSHIPTAQTLQAKAKDRSKGQGSNPDTFTITSPKPSQLGYREINAVSGSEQVGSVKIKGISQNKLEIAGLWVEPQHREQGISKSLLSGAMSEGKKEGYQAAELGVRPESPDMSAAALTEIYSRQGFKKNNQLLRGNPAMERKL